MVETSPAPITASFDQASDRRHSPITSSQAQRTWSERLMDDPMLVQTTARARSSTKALKSTWVRRPEGLSRSARSRFPTASRGSYPRDSLNRASPALLKDNLLLLFRGRCPAGRPRSSCPRGGRPGPALGLSLVIDRPAARSAFPEDAAGARSKVRMPSDDVASRRSPGVQRATTLPSPAPGLARCCPIPRRGRGSSSRR